jgi:hypothetical protein
VAFFGIASQHHCQPISLAPTLKNTATVSVDDSDPEVATAISVTLCNDAAAIGPFRSSWQAVTG